MDKDIIIDLSFDGPHIDNNNNDYNFYAEGCSPYIFAKIVKFIKDNKNSIREINFSLYLFDNLLLANELLKLSRQGVVINVYSIPLDGYDKKTAKNPVFKSFFSTKKLNQRKSEANKSSKYCLAERIYSYFAQHDNINLFIYDHIYLRSRHIKPFARGQAPYSLHIKSIFVEMKDGQSYTGLTSSNLALRDLRKEEMYLLIKNSAKSHTTNIDFYAALKRNACHIKDFHQRENWIYRDQCSQCNNFEFAGIFYTASFLYNSNYLLANTLKNVLSQANTRIYICAQHVNLTIPPLQNKTVPINIITQTYIDDSYDMTSNCITINGEKIRTRVPANKESFKLFIRNIRDNYKARYYVNDHIHLKFIVVDDTVIISTGNFTATQLIYTKIAIQKFDHFQGAYQGIFSEINTYYQIRDAELANTLVSHFNMLKKRPNSRLVFKSRPSPD